MGIKELEDQLTNIQKQSDIDMNHVFNVNNEIEDKKREIESLKEMQKEIEANHAQRQEEIREEYLAQIKDLKDGMLALKQMNYQIESDLQIKNINLSKSKMD